SRSRPCPASRAAAPRRPTSSRRARPCAPAPTRTARRASGPSAPPAAAPSRSPCVGLCLRLPTRAGLPERLAALVRGPREDEEQVGEPIQVDGGERVDCSLGGGGKHLPLSAAAGPACDVQSGG